MLTHSNSQKVTMEANQTSAVRPWAIVAAVFVAGQILSAPAGTVLNYESFGNASDGSSVNNYQSTTPGYSVGLSGAWSQTYNNGATLQHRSSSTGWTGAQANLTTIGSTFSIQSGGYFNFLECLSWNLEQAQAALSTPIDMTTNGTWYMSFCSSSGDFNYAAQMGLNDGTNELMWGNGYSGSGQGLAAHFGAMSSYNNAGAIKGSSNISPTMSAAFDVILYVAQLQQSGGTVTVK
ncbi:MAG TPA: hypothetical protein VFF11_15110, partial [Candidatus Binatia bacterium]|nr:hypothetical protein [Candidatus Binatia bacterium]